MKDGLRLYLIATPESALSVGYPASTSDSMVDRTDISPQSRLLSGSSPLLQWYPLVPPYNDTRLFGRLQTRIFRLTPTSRAQLAQTRQLDPWSESGIDATPISNPHLSQPLVTYDGSIPRISWDSRE